MEVRIDLASLALFCFVSSITPGPNNVLVMRSGARFGVRPTAPHVVGIAAGMVGLSVLSHLGLGAVLLALPSAFTVLRWACFAYLLWLAWRVLRDAGPAGDGGDGARPMRLAEAAAFQLVNPKAWMMAVTSLTAFSAGGAGLTGLAAVTACFVVIGMPCVFVWAVWGAGIHRVLQRPGSRRAFNVAMAACVAASAVMAL
jgi:threonine/homoserine/homoserine lactone efflux protein